MELVKHKINSPENGGNNSGKLIKTNANAT